MKKKLVYIGVALIMCISIGFFSGCGEKQPKELSVEKQLQIKQDYWNENYKDNTNGVTVSDIKISKYYGTYSESVVLMIKENATQALWQDDIGGVLFKYNDGNQIIVWKDSQFYGLREAYESAFLSKNDLKNIAKIQNGR